MAIGSLKDLYFDELGDLYDAETQMIRTLPRLAESARAPELRELLTKHSEESRLHLERLELIFTHWSERRRSRPCAGLAGIVQEADDRLHDAATEDVRDAAIIGAAQRIEHYEIAAYGCARTYARRLNRDDEARLLQETLDEEGRADRRLTELAEAHINDDARSEIDLQDKGESSRLRYLDVDNVPRARNGIEPLQVLTNSDESLGSLDGLVVDDEIGGARYAVVRSGSVLAVHRYLLPINRIRFDADARVLRADIMKDVATRYPTFDRAEFHAMSGADRRRFGARLMEFFRAERGQPPPEPVPGIPEWWITGAWVTVPASRAAELPDEARSFANEFVPDREQMVARERDLDVGGNEARETTPPHGDKLR